MCSKTFNGYGCRNESEDREGKYLAPRESCFHKSTLVRLENGKLKSLESIKVGDKVMT